MKNSNQVKSESTKATSHRNTPENKDNLDSRKNEEFDVKSGKTTHHEKETKEDKAKK